uniref:DUF4203 domain-containing protein n=1 Tax=Panagrellus redivivus TaxID=6233 RepID=A0A7E4V4T1_PANRE
MAEPIVKTITQYRGEFEETYEGLRKRATAFQGVAKDELVKYQEKLAQLQPQINAQRDELIQVLQDVNAPVEEGAPAKLMEALLWTATIQFGYHLAFLFIGGALSGLVGVVFDTYPAIFLAYLLIPIAAILHIKANNDSDVTTRFKILSIAAVEGILTGFLFSNRYLASWQPAPFISTAVLAAAAPIVAEKVGNARTAFIGGTVGAALGVQLVLGLLSGNLGFAYLLLSVLYAGIGFATVQFYLKYSANDTAKAAYYVQLGYFFASILVQALVFFLFGIPADAVAATRNAEAEAEAARAAAAPIPRK